MLDTRKLIIYNYYINSEDLNMSHLAQCGKCKGNGQQINYVRGRDIQSRCAKCDGNGVRFLKTKPKRQYTTVVWYFTGVKLLELELYLNEDFINDFEDCFDRFNDNHAFTQKLYAYKP